MTDPFNRLDRHYILDENRQLIAVEMLVWARWYDNFENRVVEQTDTDFFHVSTVFLGPDHNFFGKGPPLVFETMVFEKKPEVMQFPDLEGAVRSIDRLKPGPKSFPTRM